VRFGPFIRDSTAVASSQYLARAVLLVRGIVTAAALGPFGYGGWNALNLIFDYGSYASAGAIQGLDLTLPAAVERGERERARRLMAGAWSVAIAGGCAFAVGLAVYLGAGGRAFAAVPGADLPFLMLGVASFQLAYQYGGSSLRAHGRIQSASLANAVQAVVGGGLGIALVWAYGIRGVLWGWIAGSALGWFMLRRGGREIPWRPGSPPAGLELMRTGLPMFAFFLATLLLRSVDRLALLHYASPEALGLYSLGLMAASMITYLPEAAAYVLLPRLASAALGARDPARTREEAVRVQRALTLFLPPLVGIGVVLAEPVVTRLLPAYRAGLPALTFLAIGALMLSAGTIPAYALLAAGGRGRLLAIGFGGAVFNAVLTFGVASRAPRPEAVALAAGAGFTLVSLAMVLAASRQWCESVAARGRLLAGSFIPAVWGALLTLAVCRFGEGTAWAVALGRAAVLLVGYAPALLAFGHGLGGGDPGRARPNP
jgi:O-antigen/teichoic acid export membrane protein